MAGRLFSTKPLGPNVLKVGFLKVLCNIDIVWKMRIILLRMRCG